MTPHPTARPEPCPRPSARAAIALAPVPSSWPAPRRWDGRPGRHDRRVDEPVRGGHRLAVSSAAAAQPTPVPTRRRRPSTTMARRRSRPCCRPRSATVALERLSLTGPDFYALGTDATRAQLDTMLGKLGKKVTDLSVADAGDPRGLTVIEIGIFRVAGAMADRLLSEWVASTLASNPGQISSSSVTIDGRQVTKLVDQSRPVGGVTYAFVKDDTLFAVRADDQALLSSALSQLPTP